MDSIFVKVFFFASKILAFRARPSLPLSYTSLNFCLICYSCYSCDICSRVLLLLNENSCHFCDLRKIWGLLEDLLYLFFHIKKVKIFAKFVILLILAVYFVSVFFVVVVIAIKILVTLSIFAKFAGLLYLFFVSLNFCLLCYSCYYYDIYQGVFFVAMKVLVTLCNFRRLL